MRGFCAGTRASVKRIARRSQRPQRENYRGNGWSDMRGFCAGTIIDMNMPDRPRTTTRRYTQPVLRAAFSDPCLSHRLSRDVHHLELSALTLIRIPLRDLCAMLSPFRLVLAQKPRCPLKNFPPQSPSVASVTSVRCFSHFARFSHRSPDVHHRIQSRFSLVLGYKL
jgi:hypothetical protein